MLHQCLISLGHDEYWSLQMRNGASTARDFGVNLVFLGANACYRQIRLEPSPLGPNRLEICYKSAREDPLYGIDNALVTSPSWDSPPDPRPESILIGAMYRGLGANGDLVVVDASSWVFAGTGLANGDRLPGVVQGEYDRYDPSYAGPRNVEVAAHSPVVTTPNSYSDVTWYTVPGGGGVFDSGCASWVFKLSNARGPATKMLPGPAPAFTDVLLRVMENVYSTLGLGPGSLRAPSSANWQRFYTASGEPR